MSSNQKPKKATPQKQQNKSSQNKENQSNRNNNKTEQELILPLLGSTDLKVTKNPQIDINFWENLFNAVEQQLNSGQISQEKKKRYIKDYTSSLTGIIDAQILEIKAKYIIKEIKHNIGAFGIFIERFFDQFEKAYQKQACLKQNQNQIQQWFIDIWLATCKVIFHLNGNLKQLTKAKTVKKSESQVILFIEEIELILVDVSISKIIQSKQILQTSVPNSTIQLFAQKATNDELKFTLIKKMLFIENKIIQQCFVSIFNLQYFEQTPADKLSYMIDHLQNQLNDLSKKLQKQRAMNTLKLMKEALSNINGGEESKLNSKRKQTAENSETQISKKGKKKVEENSNKSEVQNNEQEQSQGKNKQVISHKKKEKQEQKQNDKISYLYGLEDDEEEQDSEEDEDYSEKEEEESEKEEEENDIEDEEEEEENDIEDEEQDDKEEDSEESSDDDEEEQMNEEQNGKYINDLYQSLKNSLGKNDDEEDMEDIDDEEYQQLMQERDMNWAIEVINSIEIDYIDENQLYQYDVDIEGMNYDAVIKNEKSKKIMEEILSQVPQYLFLDEKQKIKYFKDLNRNYLKNLNKEKQILEHNHKKKVHFIQDKFEFREFDKNDTPKVVDNTPTMFFNARRATRQSN